MRTFFRGFIVKLQLLNWRRKIGAKFNLYSSQLFHPSTERERKKLIDLVEALFCTSLVVGKCWSYDLKLQERGAAVAAWHASELTTQNMSWPGWF